MKKITFLLMATLIVVSLNAQNKLQNGGFEEDLTTFTVEEEVGGNTLNVLRRVNNIGSTTTATSNPTSTATTVTEGMWVKRILNTYKIKSIVTTDDKQEGNRSLHYVCPAGITSTGLTAWYRTIASQQKINGGLDATKKYKVTFWAKKDDTAENGIDEIKIWVRDQDKNKTKQMGVTLSDTWEEYTREFDLPSFAGNATFTNAYFGISCPSTYEAGATKYVGVLLDNILLEEKTSTDVNTIKNASFTTYALQNQIIVKGVKAGENISVFNTLGATVATLKANEDVTNININTQGVYLVRVNNSTQKVLVK